MGGSDGGGWLGWVGGNLDREEQNELDLGGELCRQNMPAPILSVWGFESVEPVFQTITLCVDPELYTACSTWGERRGRERVREGWEAEGIRS